MTVPELEELLTDEQRQDLQVQLARLEDQAFSCYVYFLLPNRTCTTMLMNNKDVS